MSYARFASQLLFPFFAPPAAAPAHALPAARRPAPLLGARSYPPATGPTGATDEAGLTTRAAACLRAAGADDELVTQVVVRWNARLLSTAGQADLRRWTVRLNPRLCDPHLAPPEELDRTLKHELAHLLAHWEALHGAPTLRRAGGRHPRRPVRPAPHGPEWRQACARLGIPGEARCHHLPLPRRPPPVRRHHYRCPRCELLWPRVRPLPPRPQVACRRCCREHADGRFDPRFVFRPVPTPGTGGGFP